MYARVIKLSIRSHASVSIFLFYPNFIASPQKIFLRTCGLLSLLTNKIIMKIDFFNSNKRHVKASKKYNVHDNDFVIKRKFSSRLILREACDE